MFARAVTVLVAVLCLADVSAFAQPQSAGPSSLILFENVRIFDGKSSTLSGGMNVLVRGNTIDKISKDPIPVDRSAGTRIIAGGGRTLMPGLSAIMAAPTCSPRDCGEPVTRGTSNGWRKSPWPLVTLIMAPDG